MHYGMCKMHWVRLKTFCSLQYANPFEVETYILKIEQVKFKYFEQKRRIILRNVQIWS